MHTAIQWLVLVDNASNISHLYAVMTMKLLLFGNGGDDVVGAVVVFNLVHSSHFFLDNHLSINVFCHKQITSTIISIRQSGVQ